MRILTARHPGEKRRRGGQGKRVQRLTITCVRLLSGAVHVSIEDGGWSSRSCANGVIVPAAFDLEIRRFLPSLFLGSFSSFASEPRSLSSPRFSFFPSLFDSMDLTGTKNGFFSLSLSFFHSRLLNCRDYLFFYSIVLIASDIVLFATFIIFLIRGARL